MTYQVLIRLQVLQLHPDKLQPNGWNSNVVSPENETKLDASVSRFGMFKPILARRIYDDHGEEGFEILGGEHRWAVAKRQGLESIPVCDLGHISEDQAREISLADNARYGSDDAAALADILKSLGGTESEIQDFLPYTDADVRSIFTSVSIDLDNLELDENFDAKSEDSEPVVAKEPKTHTVMRFKIPLKDAENITALITKLQKRHGYTEADALTNAGDALVHLVYGVKGEID